MPQAGTDLRVQLPTKTGMVQCDEPHARTAFKQKNTTTHAKAHANRHLQHANYQPAAWSSTAMCKEEPERTQQEATTDTVTEQRVTTDVQVTITTQRHLSK